MERLRLDKILTDTGRWSRKEAKELIRKGSVSVNGAVVRKSDSKWDAEAIQLTVAGDAVHWQKYTYLLMNKPGGVLTATEDRRQPTVLDLLPQEFRRQGLVPVGRLDKDTEGLLLLTNDGELTHRLLSPNYHVDKVYRAVLDDEIHWSDIRAFEVGLVLSDGTLCRPAGLVRSGERECLVTLREGKFHQVKRMLAERGKTVLALTRLSMGTLKLDDSIPKGRFRSLSDVEIRELLEVCHMMRG